ncbi:MAG: hypothetical protein Q9208_002515 [Pyrenodesmia sp. 3 TL-2023]
MATVGCESGLRILWRRGGLDNDEPDEHRWNPDGTLVLGASVKGVHGANPRPNVKSTGPEPGADDYDPSEPYDAITHPVNLGVAVLHLAFPYIPTDASQQNCNALPSILMKNLVAVVVCSDSSVRLVILPLAPPSAKIKQIGEEADESIVINEQTGVYGATCVVVLGGNGHQGTPKYAALTLAPVAIADLDIDDSDIQLGKSNSTDRRRLLSQTHSRSRSRSLSRGEGCDIMVASGPADASGAMLIHRIPVSMDGSSLDLTLSDHSVPWSIQHFPFSMASLNFNPSLPGEEMNGRLLVVESRGTVRVLDCTSAAYSKQCSSLVSLYSSSRAAASGGARKHFLDAQWVLGGKAILALADDGEWGIWDLKGHGPKAQSGTLAPQIPTIGSFFTFAISGRVHGGSNTSHATDSRLKTTEGSKAVKLAPTTPSTRRVRQENLFTGPPHHTEGLAQGGISVLAATDTTMVDEAILMWHNDTMSMIPSLRTHWGNKLKGSGDLFGKEAKAETRVIRDLAMKGERHTGANLLCANYGSTGERSLEFAVLITGETRLVVLTNPSGCWRRVPAVFKTPPSYQRLLEQGDLNLKGMGRVFLTMGDKEQTEKSTTRGMVSFINI